MSRARVCFGLVLLGAGALVATSLHGAAARTTVLLADSFAGARLNTRVWNTCHWWAADGCTIASNHELEWYLPGQVRVSGGHLHLVAERRRVRGADGRAYPFVSGMVTTGPPSDTRPAKFAFRYGRAEARMRVPRGKGLWSAFWLLPSSRSSKPEIDVMEMVGDEPGTVSMHLHPGPGEGGPGKDFTSARLRSGWHRFAIDWRPNRLRWLIDGVERWRVTGSSVPREPMYLVMNLAVGGDSPGPPSSSTRFPSSLLVDSVKVSR